MVVREYVFRVLIGFDQFFNTLIGGYPDETVSSRLGKNRHKSKTADVICTFLDWIDPDHCFHAIENDEGERV